MNSSIFRSFDRQEIQFTKCKEVLL
jgi:hypothetical protein